MLKFSQQITKGADKMARDYSQQLSQILVTLKNINDNIRRLDEEMFDLHTRLSKATTMKHLVVIKKDDTLKGGNKNV